MAEIELASMADLAGGRHWRDRPVEFFDDFELADSGLLVPAAVFETVARPPLGIDLFAGAGGFSCGFHQAGWHVICASEWWPLAAETYLANLGTASTRVYVGETAAPDATKRERKVFETRGGEIITAAEFFELLPRSKANESDDRPWGPGSSGYADTLEHPCELLLCCDVRELTGDMIVDLLGLNSGGEVGCVFGGPPCQGFSRAGRQERGDDRNQLVFEFARLVCEIGPQAMMMENVPGILDMVTPEGVPVIDALSLILSNGGMGTYDALRKSLLANVDAGAVVKGASRHTKAETKANGDKLGLQPTHGDSDAADEQLAMEVA